MAAAANMSSLPPHVDRGPGILIVSWIEAVLGISMTILRFYTRSKIVRIVGWDDWTMGFATLLALATTIIVTLEVHYGTGRHTAYLSPPDIVSAVKMIWLTTPFSTMSACFGKISIALLLMRIMNRNKPYEIFLWGLIVILFVVNLLLTILTFSQCTPVTYLWDQFNPEVGYKGSCWSPHIQQYYGYFQGAFSSLSDLVLALFPILIIWNLQMDLRKKFGLAVIMGLGLIAVIASVIKTVELMNLATPDFTFDATNLVYWYITENWVIVIAACIPTLLPLYLVLLGKASEDSFRRGGTSEGKTYWFRRWSMRSWLGKMSSGSSSAYKNRHDGYSVQQRELGHSGHSLEQMTRPGKDYHHSKDGTIRKTTDVSIV